MKELDLLRKQNVTNMNSYNMLGDINHFFPLYSLLRFIPLNSFLNSSALQQVRENGSFVD